MNLEVRRTDKSDQRTIGLLYIDGVHSMYTLEDTTRSGPKIPGKTAIPAGVYRIIITHSKRFGKALPLVLNVPGFEGIRFHAGNTHKDTKGCVLVGLNRGQDRILESQLAMDQLQHKIMSALGRGEEVWLHVS